MIAWLRRHPVLFWVVLGFLLRLGFFLYWENLHGAYAVTPDDDYWARALMLVHGERLALFEDLFRPPLYTWLLYLFIKAFGPHPAVVQVLQCLLGAACGWVLYRMGKSLGSERAGIGAAALWSINVYSIYYSSHLMTEVLYVALVLLFFWAWLEAQKSENLAWSAWAGLLAGATCLCRWMFFGYLPWFAAAETIGAFRKRVRWRTLAVAMILIGLIVGLWAARNQARYGRPLLAGPQKGWNFYEGLALQTREDTDRPRAMAEESKRLGLDKDLFSQDDYFWQKGWREVCEEPRAALLIFGGKMLKFWRLAPYPPHPRLFRWGSAIFYLTLFSLALHGAFRVRHLRAELLPILLFILYTWLLHTVFFSGIRYRFPLDPFLSLLAGFSLAQGWKKEEETVLPKTDNISGQEVLP